MRKVKCYNHIVRKWVLRELAFIFLWESMLMNPKEPETIRCPFKAGETPETLEYPCSVCKIARIRRRKRHWGKHLECTFELARKKKRKVKTETPKAASDTAAPAKENPKPGNAAITNEKPRPKKSPREKKRQRKKAPPQPALRDDYDGYYDDVLPLDHGSVRQGLDTAVAQKVIVLIIVVLLIVAACVLVMYFL